MKFTVVEGIKGFSKTRTITFAFCSCAVLFLSVFNDLEKAILL